VFGVIWSSIAGLLKARLNMHEVITTIMLNYIAFSITGWAVAPGGPLKAEGSIPASPTILAAAKLPRILAGTRLHAGIFIALLMVAIVWYLLFRTRLGYAIRAVGSNAPAAEYGGINVARSIMLTMAISGFLSGLAGAVEVLGIHYRLYESFSPGYGWDAIAVALLGLLHPAGVLLAALLYGALRAGSVPMQAVADVNRDVINVISALVIVFIALARLDARRSRG
jgi:simple sugar transport system permease protein